MSQRVSGGAACKVLPPPLLSSTGLLAVGYLLPTFYLLSFPGGRTQPIVASSRRLTLVFPESDVQTTRFLMCSVVVSPFTPLRP